MKRRSEKKTSQLKTQLGIKNRNKAVNKNPPEPTDFSHIHENQNKMKAMYEKAKKNKTIMAYQKVKYKQHIYQIGQFLHLYDPQQQNPFITRLHQIIRVPTQTQGGLTILKVQWLLKKADLPPRYHQYIKHLSSAQVFPSQLFWFVPIESIMRKCYVITYQQYQYLETAGDMIHFCRAIYKNQSELLQPKIEQFKQQCYCKMPVNPDLMYIQCQKCFGWFHEECLKQQKIEDSQFYCKNCKK